MDRLVPKRFYLTDLLLIFLTSAIVLTARPRVIHSASIASSWQEQVSRHFILFYREADHRLADYLMERAEVDYKRIVEDIGIDPEIDVRIYLAPDKQTYLTLQPEGEKTHDWSIGAFYPSRNLILLLSPKAQKGHPDLHEILAHELTHFVLHTITRKKGVHLPTWLHEGLALYEARQWNWHYRTVMAQASLSKAFLPLSSLSRGFPAQKRLADRAYAQSISLIAYIINKYGQGALRDIIRNLVEGNPTDTSFYNALGIDIEVFEKKWHAYLRRSYTWIPVLTSSFFIWFIISLMVLGIYIHKKRLSEKRMAIWDIEDQIDSLYH